MPILGLNVKDAKPEHVVPAGQYTLRVTSAKRKTSSTGREMIALSFSIVDDPSAAPVFHNLLGALQEDSEELKQRWVNNLAQFLAVFGLSDVEDEETLLEEAIGAEGKCVLRIESDDEYGERNTISRFVA